MSYMEENKMQGVIGEKDLKTPVEFLSTHPGKNLITLVLNL